VSEDQPKRSVRDRVPSLERMRPKSLSAVGLVRIEQRARNRNGLVGGVEPEGHQLHPERCA
jgi:hypothetical protein